MNPNVYDVITDNFTDYVPEIIKLCLEYAYDIENSVQMPDDVHNELTKKLSITSVESNQSTTTRVLGKLHSIDDQPAIVLRNGAKLWYKNNVLHRENGPAIIRPNGSELWMFEGEIHRDNGPAIIDPTLNRESYYTHGKLRI